MRDEAKYAVESVLQSVYVNRMQEYEAELAQRRLIVFLAKLGIKSAQKLLPFNEYITSSGISS